MRSALLALCLLLLPAPLLGQSEEAPQQPQAPRDRPVEGLFGGFQRDPARYRSLDLSFSFLGGYDDSIDPEGGGGHGDPLFTRSGGLGTASAALSFRRSRDGSLLTAGARAAYRYYPSLTELNAADYGANVGLLFQPSGRTHVGLRGSTSYQPYFSFSALPGAGPATGEEGVPGSRTDYFIERPSLAYGADLDFDYDLSRRSHATLAYSFRGLDFTGTGDDGRLRDQEAGAGINRDLTRRWRIGGRYVHSRGENFYTGEAFHSTSHGGGLTLDYRRTLRSRRRLAVSLAPGFSRVEQEGGLLPRRIDRRVTASLRASVDLTRSWRLDGDYRRGLRYIPGVRRPVFADEVRTQLSGLLGRRLDFAASAEYSEGDPGIARTGLRSLGGTSQLRFALGRGAAITANYAYYRYDFGRDALLPDGLERRFSRHSFRLGLNLWLPLFEWEGFR